MNHPLRGAALACALLLALLLPASPASAQARTAIADDPDALAGEVERIAQELAAAGDFSGAVLLAHDGEVLYEDAFGLASRAWDAPNRTDTKFNLGSMNKMFTATAILQLIEAGDLSFDTTVGEVLPAFDNEAVREQVTVYHLLTHTSGAGDYFGPEWEDASRLRYRTIADYLPLVAEQELAFEPGAQWSYSNGGFLLLGAIVEQVSGQPYDAYVREHVFAPAGMGDTAAVDMDFDTPNLATGYTWRGPVELFAAGEPRANTFLHVIRGTSAGGGYSTVGDLLAFALALQDGDLLGPDYAEMILHGQVEIPAPPDAPVALRYGYGMQEETLNGVRRVGHSGGFEGINSELSIYPEEGYVLAVMGNYDPPAASRIAALVHKLLAGVPLPAPADVSRAALEEVAGRYTFSGPGPAAADVALHGDGILVLFDGEGHEFWPAGDGSFFDRDFDTVRAEFTRDAAGAVTGVTVTGASDEPLVGERVELPPPSTVGAVAFSLDAFPRAHVVELVGDFNDWQTGATLLAPEEAESGHPLGLWVARLDLEPGTYAYRFVVDGQPMLDPANARTAPDAPGGPASQIVVE